MHIEKLIDQPIGAPGVLLQGSVYGAAGQAGLLRDVLGLANAAGAGTRCIVFGASREGAGAPVFMPLSATDLQELESYPDIVARYIEPVLRVECVIGNARGHVVAALIINNSDNPPYIVKTDAGSDLRRGDCWIREGGFCRPAQRADYDRMYRVAAARQPVVQLGFATDPFQDTLSLIVPDSSQPPSALVGARIRNEIDVQRAARSVNIEDTRLSRLMHARLYGSEQRFESQGLDTLIQRYNSVLNDHRDQDNYYYFETRALQLSFSIVNTAETPLENVRVMLQMPWAESFRVADRLYGAPGKPITKSESDLRGYPAVQKQQKLVQVLTELSRLEPGAITPMFEQPLRIAVRSELAGKKVALRYTVQAKGLKRPEEGRLKLLLVAPPP
jgi:hypothetical protein